MKELEKLDISIFTEKLAQLPCAKDVKVAVDERNIVRLSGVCNTWAELVSVGHLMGKIPGVYSVVNDIVPKDVIVPQKDYKPLIAAGKAKGVIDTADVVIVGGGVIGCGIARELSRYDLKIILVEKDEDVANGATKANNGDIHSGYLEKTTALKTKLNVKGNAMYDDWAKDLGFELHRRGNLLVINSEAFQSSLEEAKARADANGVPSEYVTGEQIMEMEPLARQAKIPPVAGLFVPSMANVDPWCVAIALAENAIENGVRIMLSTTVCDVGKDASGITEVVTDRGVIKTNYLINCAGIYADEISNMAGDHAFTIHPRKGTIAIVDKNIPAYTRPYRIVDEDRPLFGSGNSKGGGMATTVAGNNLLGPSATEVPDREDLSSEPTDLDYAMLRNSIDALNKRTIIRYFTGSRPATYTEDFFIERSPVAKGLVNVAGIQSPGLASAPAIAEYAISLLSEMMEHSGKGLKPKASFNPLRKEPVKFAQLSREEQDALIHKDPSYGKIICRCETISEGEILEALRSPLVPTSVDAIKRRTRAGMGRCQGGFCQPRVVEILARVLEEDMTNIQLKEAGSHILAQENRVEG